MNLKKLFATSAVLTLAVSTFAPAINSAKADYNSEINSAYSYAYERNVTTLPTVESANPMGKAIRGHVAKMISNWALVVLNRQPNEAVKPVFTDIAGESEEIQGYIKKSAQQGLMGQGISAFGPQNLVTRAQFGTVLSRALFGDKYNDGNPYYVKHLENLKKVGIMNDITNVERPVLRYEIWLMLQRAEKLVSKDQNDGLTADQILKCFTADDYLACLNETKGNNTKDDDKTGEVLKKGDLRVSIENKSSKIVSIPGTATSILAKVKFSGSEKISLNSVTVSRVGLGNNSKIKNVWFERNGMRASNKATITADNEGVIRFNNGFEVEANEVLDFVVELQDSTGGEYAFKINAIDSSAKDVVIDPNTTSTFRTTEYRVAQLEVGTLNHSKEQSEYRINGNNSYDMGRFTLYNESPKKEDRVIRVQNLNFRNIKGGDLNNLKDWSLLRDGQKINAKATIDGKYLSFSLADSIKASRTAVYTVTAVPVAVELEEGDKYKLELRNSGDVVAVEEGVEGVEYRVMPFADDSTAKVVSTTTNDDICDAYGKNVDAISTMVVTVNKINQTEFEAKASVTYKNDSLETKTEPFKTDVNKATEEAARNYVKEKANEFFNSIQTSMLRSCLADLNRNKVVIVNNYGATPLNTHWESIAGKLVIIKGGSLFLTKDQNFASTVTAGTGYSNVVLAKGKMNIAQSVRLGELKITSKNNNLDEIIKRAWIVIGGKRYSTSKGQGTGIYWNELIFDHDFYIGQGEHDIELVVNITKDAKENAVVEFNPIKWKNFAPNSNYTNSEETKLDLGKDGIGQLNISDLYIQKSSIGLTKTSNAGNIEVVVGNSDTKELFAGVVTNNLGKTIYFDDLKLVLRWTKAAKYADVYVEVDGNQRSSQFPLYVNTTDTTITIPSIPGSLEPGKSATIKLIGVVDGNLPKHATMDGTLQLTAMADGNRLVSTIEVLSTLKITPAGTTSIIGGSAGKNQAVLVNVANVDIFDTLFTVRNDTQTLRSIDFVYSTWNAGSDITDIILKSVDVMYKKQGDKDTAWTKLARKGLFTVTTGTYAAGTFTDNQSGTGKNVSIEINPAAFPVGNYEVKVVGSFENYGISGTPRIAPVMKIDGVKLGFAKDSKYYDMTTNNQKLISVAYPVLSATNKVSSSNNNAFTLVVTKPNDTSVASIKVTKVVTEVFSNGKRTITNPTRAQYNGNNVDDNNAPSTTSVNAPIEIQVQSAQNPVRVKAIEYEVTDADGYVTKYTADGSYGIVNVGVLKS